MPGEKIFLTTRLLIESRQIDDIAGVIGHEIGHIVGGHFTQRVKEMEKTSMISIISSILAAGGNGCWSWASWYSNTYGWTKPWNWKKFLSFSRTQESLADQTAIRLLKNSGFSLEGMLNIFEILERNESLKKLTLIFLHTLYQVKEKK